MVAITTVHQSSFLHRLKTDMSTGVRQDRKGILYRGGLHGNLPKNKDCPHILQTIAILCYIRLDEDKMHFSSNDFRTGTSWELWCWYRRCWCYEGFLEGSCSSPQTRPVLGQQTSHPEKKHKEREKGVRNAGEQFQNLHLQQSRSKTHSETEETSESFNFRRSPALCQLWPQSLTSSTSDKMYYMETKLLSKRSGTLLPFEQVQPRFAQEDAFWSPEGHAKLTDFISFSLWTLQTEQ